MVPFSSKFTHSLHNLYTFRCCLKFSSEMCTLVDIWTKPNMPLLFTCFGGDRKCYIRWAIMPWLQGSGRGLFINHLTLLVLRLIYSGELGNTMASGGSIGIPIIKMRWSYDRLILVMKIPIPGKAILRLGPGDDRNCLHWHCRRSGSLFSLRKDFNQLCHLSVKTW